MYSASDLRKGLKIEIDGVPYEVTEYNFFKPGKGQAMYKCRIKNLITQTTQDKTFREVDKIDEPNLEVRTMHYSYHDGASYVFSDSKTFEEYHINEQQLGIKKFFIVEEMEVTILFHNGQPIDIQVPTFIEKEIAETEPGVRGDTATNVTKPARLDNGYEIKVPLFINIGDWVRIDTRTGEYVDRISKR